MEWAGLTLQRVLRGHRGRAHFRRAGSARGLSLPTRCVCAHSASLSVYLLASQLASQPHACLHARLPAARPPAPIRGDV